MKAGRAQGESGATVTAMFIKYRTGEAGRGKEEGGVIQSLPHSLNSCQVSSYQSPTVHAIYFTHVSFIFYKCPNF
jgi:predicted component of type VI protein secretion system